MRALLFVVVVACGSSKTEQSSGSASHDVPSVVAAADAALVGDDAELAAIAREMAELEQEEVEVDAERDAATTDAQKRVVAEKHLDVLRRMKVVQGRKIEIMRKRATKGQPANDSPCTDNPLAKGCM